MYKALHTLRLVLPQRPQMKFHAHGGEQLRRYVWPCGCIASGPDEAALAVRCCGTHVDLLAQAPITRTSM